MLCLLDVIESLIARAHLLLYEPLGSKARKLILCMAGTLSIVLSFYVLKDSYENHQNFVDLLRQNIVLSVDGNDLLFKEDLGLIEDGLNLKDLPIWQGWLRSSLDGQLPLVFIGMLFGCLSIWESIKSVPSDLSFCQGLIYFIAIAYLSNSYLSKVDGIRVEIVAFALFFVFDDWNIFKTFFINRNKLVPHGLFVRIFFSNVILVCFVSYVVFLYPGTPSVESLETPLRKWLLFFVDTLVRFLVILLMLKVTFLKLDTLEDDNDSLLGSGKWLTLIAYKYRAFKVRCKRVLR